MYIEINSCGYFTFKQMLEKMDVKELLSIHQNTAQPRKYQRKGLL